MVWRAAELWMYLGTVGRALKNLSSYFYTLGSSNQLTRALRTSCVHSCLDAASQTMDHFLIIQYTCFKKRYSIIIYV